MQFLKKIVLLHIVIFVLRNFFYILEKITPKKQEHLLFFLTEKYYFDNSKYLFEYMRKHTNRTCKLFTRDKKLYFQLNKKFPDEVIYAYTLKGFWHFLRTKQVVISYGTSAAAFAPYYLHEKGKQIIYLGHGTPMKRIGYQTPVWNKFGKSYQLQKYSYLTACSDIECLMLASGFRATLNNIWITGLPRYDFLLSKNNCNKQFLEQHQYLGEKIILYAPTWREEGNETIFFPFDDYTPNKLQQFLEQNNAYLLIRGHKESIKRNSLRKDAELFALSRVIKAEQDIFPDVTELLPFVDILVTDYSSIMVDFLLLNRPMVFIPYDLESYNSYKGILLDYAENTPGKKIDTMQKFIVSTKQYIDNPELDVEWRIKIKEKYHKYKDTNNCERVAKEINSIITTKK